MESPIKGFIFDAGGVIIRYNNLDFYRRLSIRCNKSFDLVRSVIESKPLIDFEKGIISYREFKKIISDRLGIKAKDLRWVEDFSENSSLDLGTIDIIKRLKEKHYKIAVLSNIDRSRYKALSKVIRDYRYLFNCIIPSFKIHHRKPEKEAFDYALNRMKLSYNNIIFIDDLKENVNGASKLGIRSILFKDYKSLIKELNKI
ncbi:MAG: phosphoglycolate phosphatase [Candidatus Micrarchaeota archaeon]|nr:MAG: phosphoglycolate phosphatase [Candidatus Micrarchaeota archaeon]